MRILSLSIVTAVACLFLNPATATADDNYQAAGKVQFGNLVKTLQFMGESSPYLGIGDSPLLGVNVQTGSILPTSAPVPVGFDWPIVTLQFTGEPGPHPIPGQGNIHIIHAQGGKIFCTWVALFTIELNLDTGDAVFSGDGEFTIVGGTGRFRHATGSFRTLFETEVVPAGADSALADFTQDGEIHRE